jgi:hypothetical protein
LLTKLGFFEKRLFESLVYSKLNSLELLQAVVKYAARKGFPRDKFELMANFPKRLLLTMDSEMTLKDAGLFPHDTIFVQAR